MNRSRLTVLAPTVVAVVALVLVRRPDDEARQTATRIDVMSGAALAKALPA